MTRIRVIDSHTAGEPTRVVISGGPDLGSDALINRVERFRNYHDDFRSAIVSEPRAFEGVVAALLCPPVDESCVTGVIFFNSVSYLGMCGHGTIGVVTTLAYLNRIGPGTHRIETPVGVVVAHLDENGEVEVTNVPSYRLAANVTVDVPGVGPVTGDVAWRQLVFPRKRSRAAAQTRESRGVDGVYFTRSRIVGESGNYRA